ncbi:MAG: cell division protein FtsL [Candidatus Marinimicrobia bacterium]|nr:cell division protein FtsL [Candidatus Neomarinimicrobiota bacterium]MCF6267440.1 cell division protein FtsL [Desulfuromusa sp.]
MSEAVSQATVKMTGFSFYRPRFSSVCVAIMLVSVLSLLFVWSRIHAINLEYNISSLERDIRSQEQQITELKLEAAFLARDERIEKLAKKVLGLRAPSPGQIIRVE